MGESYSKKHSCTLVLVVRNEASNLRAIAPRLPLNVFDDCFAMDGNSTDGTVEALRALGIRSYAQKKKGLGAAMLESRAYVKTDSFVFFHPDGNEDPADLPRMIELLKQGHDFVVASRMIEGARNEEDGEIFKVRKYANKAFTGLANFFFSKNGNRASDAINGFRGQTCRAFDQMKLTSLDLTIDYQMIIHALRYGVRITEFPTKEGDRLNGETNFSSFPAGIAELSLLLREIKEHYFNRARS